jgi:hypothetical protein
MVLYATAYVGAVVADGGNAVAEGWEQLPALVIGCAVVQAFAAMLARHERSLSRERILREASSALVDARDRAAVYAATLRAVELLGHGRPPAGVIALGSSGGDGLVVRAATGPWLPGVVGSSVTIPSEVTAALDAARACAIESPRQAGLELFAPPDVAALEGVFLPLSVRGSARGFLAAFGPAVAEADEAGALGALAEEAALALAAADGADAAAVDRSIERFTQGARGMI